MSASEPRRTVPRGDVEPWTDAELEALAEPTAEDIAGAQEAVRRWLPRSSASLLDARATNAGVVRDERR